MCATTETPEAQYLPFFSAPNIFDLNFFGNVPDTVDLLTPTLSKIFPSVNRHEVPPPSLIFPLHQNHLEKFNLLSSKNSKDLHI
jgi:hypothetical protein